MPMPIQIVVIGASLGGLVALQRLLSALPVSFGPPIAIAQHRLADHDSRLLQLLARECALPVVEPNDKLAIEQGHVYLAPPDYHLLVDRGTLCLSVDEPVTYARPSIDVLFESAAEAYGSATVGILLTGSSDDGAAGIAAVARVGGRTFVEDPTTAESAVAPRAAIARTKPNHVLPLPAIAPALLRACAA